MEKMKANAKEVAHLLKIFANENRLLILCELSKGNTTVSDLTKKLDITQSGISQHLAILKANGIVDYDKQAQTVCYSIKDNRILKLLNTIKETYCK